MFCHKKTDFRLLCNKPSRLSPGRPRFLSNTQTLKNEYWLGSKNQKPEEVLKTGSGITTTIYFYTIMLIFQKLISFYYFLNSNYSLIFLSLFIFSLNTYGQSDCKKIFSSSEIEKSIQNLKNFRVEIDTSPSKDITNYKEVSKLIIEINSMFKNINTDTPRNNRQDLWNQFQSVINKKKAENTEKIDQKKQISSHHLKQIKIQLPKTKEEEASERALGTIADFALTGGVFTGAKTIIESLSGDNKESYELNRLKEVGEAIKTAQGYFNEHKIEMTGSDKNKAFVLIKESRDILNKEWADFKNTSNQHLKKIENQLPFTGKEEGEFDRIFLEVTAIIGTGGDALPLVLLIRWLDDTKPSLKTANEAIKTAQGYLSEHSVEMTGPDKSRASNLIKKARITLKIGWGQYNDIQKKVNEEKQRQQETRNRERQARYEAKQKSKQDFISKQEEFISDREDFISGQEDFISRMEDSISDREGFISRQKNFISKQEDFISDKEDFISKQENFISKQDNWINAKKNNIEKLQNNIEKLQSQIDSANSENFIDRVTGWISENKSEISEIESKIESAEDNIENAGNNIETTKSKIYEAQNKIESAENNIKNAQNKIYEARNKIESAKNNIKNTQSEINEARNKINNAKM